MRKRFRKWGIDNKKNSESEMKAILRKTSERSRIGKASTIKSRGRPIQYSDVVRYWDRRRMSIMNVLAQINSRDTTPDGLIVITPVPSPVMPPATFETPERILKGISDFICASFESGLWFSKAENPLAHCKSRKEGTVLFFGYSTECTVEEACALFKSGRAQEAGKRLLYGTAHIKTRVVSELPFLLPEILASLYWTIGRGFPEVGTAVTRQHAALGRLLLGEFHPVPQILTLFLTMDSSEVREFIHRCLCNVKDRFENWLGFYHTTTLWIMDKCSRTMSSTQQQAERMRKTLDLLEAELTAQDPRCLAVRVEIASVCYVMGLYNEVEDHCFKNLDIGRQTHVVGSDSSIRAMSLYYLGCIHVRRGRHDIAEGLWGEAVQLTISINGEEDQMVTALMVVLEAMFLRTGRDEKATLVQQERTAIVDRQMQKLQEAEGIALELEPTSTL